MNVLGRTGGWGVAVALALAIGCSSEQMPGASAATGGMSGGAEGGTAGFAVTDGGAAADTDPGTQCDISAANVPIQAGASACAILINLPPGTVPTSIRVQDQSMVTIPESASDGWIYGDPQSPILLTGSYCADAMAGRLTAVTILLSCPGHPIP